MIFECEIDIDNDAFAPFDPDLKFELSKIIKRIAKEVNEIECIERTKTIWDINGNKVGTWQFKI